MALTISLAVAGCSSPADVAADVGATEVTVTTSSTITTTADAAAVAVSPAATTREDKAEKDGGKREFAYSWPAAVSAIPALVERFSAERDKALTEQKAEWNEALTEFAGQGCISCTSREFSKEWKVVADLPRYLSLSADMYFYTGGGHGNSDFDALVWDREARAVFAPAAMFRSEEDLQAALHAPWCKALNAERTKRLDADYDDDGMFPCPDIAQLTLLLGSSNKQTFNRIGLLAAPYVAGSYAEGPYEITLPVTPAVLAAVKPEYKSAFALGK